MATALDVGALLRRLAGARIDYILIGGLAVNAHGVIRSTADADICPAPDRANLVRLAELLRELGVRQLGTGDGGFDDRELSYNPTRVEDLAQGGNFRLETPLGVLDLMQWVAGVETDRAYEILGPQAVRASAFGVEIKVCSLEHLRMMKRAAGRPGDLQDLADLEVAHPSGG